MSSGEPVRLTREQVRLIDKLAIERYHIPGIVLMENAAHAAADVARQMIGHARSPSVLVICGGGNNGGDGLAVARHLHNQGVNVFVFPQVDPSTYSGDALINWIIVRSMNITITGPSLQLESLFDVGCNLIVDAVFGTGLTKPPRAGFEGIAEACNRGASPVLSIDVPSGLDCDTGELLGPCIRAARTITFVAEKVGFANPASKQYTGEVTVGDIGCPRELIEEVAKMSPR